MSFSAYGAFPASPSLEWPSDGPLQQPGDFLDYSYVAELETKDNTDRIVAAALAVKPSGAGEMTASQLTVSGATVTAWMTGGVAGRIYTVRITLTMASGRVFTIPIAMPIDPTFGIAPPPAPPSTDFGTEITWASGVGVWGTSTWGNFVWG